MGCGGSVPTAAIHIGPSTETEVSYAKTRSCQQTIGKHQAALATLKEQLDQLLDAPSGTANANNKKADLRPRYKTALALYLAAQQEQKAHFDHLAEIYQRRNRHLAAQVQPHKDRAEEARKAMVKALKEATESARSKAQVLHTKIALEIDEAVRKAEAVAENERLSRWASTRSAEFELQSQKAELDARYCDAMDATSEDLAKGQHQLKTKRQALVERYNGIWSDAEDNMKAASEASRKAKQEYGHHLANIMRLKALLKEKLIGLRKNSIPESQKTADEITSEEELAARKKQKISKKLREELAAAALMHEGAAEKARADYMYTMSTEPAASRRETLMGLAQTKTETAIQLLQRLHETACSHAADSDVASDSYERDSAARMKTADSFREQLDNKATRDSLKPALQVQLFAALDGAAFAHRHSLSEQKEAINCRIVAAFAQYEMARLSLNSKQWDAGGAEDDEKKKTQLEAELEKCASTRMSLEVALSKAEDEQSSMIESLLLK